MKYKNVILTLLLTLHDENININFRIKIKKPRLFHVWLFGVDLTMSKLNKRPNIFVMQ